MAHSKKISVDLRGFHIFDDGNSSSDDDSEKSAKKKTLKNRIKHAKKMSVDLSGYHIFEDNGESSSEEEEEMKKQKPKHSKKVSIDLQGFDLFYDSDSEEESEENEAAMDFKPKPPATEKEFAPNKESISQQATDNFKKAQKMYLQNDDDEDLKGFHLFDEYNSDDDEEEEDVIKLHKMEKDQLTVLVRSLLVENAILKDASQRARGKLDAKKARLKEAEESKKTLLRCVGAEMDNMRQIIFDLAQASNPNAKQR